MKGKKNESEGMKLHWELQMVEDEERTAEYEEGMSSSRSFALKEDASLHSPPPGSPQGYACNKETSGSSLTAKDKLFEKLLLTSQEERDLGVWEQQQNEMGLDKPETLLAMGTALREEALQLEIQYFEVESMIMGLSRTGELLTSKLDARMAELKSRKDKLAKREQYVGAREVDVARKEKYFKEEISDLSYREQELIRKELALHRRQWELERLQRARNKELEQSHKNAELSQFPIFQESPAEIRIMIWSQVQTPYHYLQIYSIRALPCSVLKSKPSYRTKTRNTEDDDHVQVLPEPREYGTYAYDRVAFPSQHGIHPILHACQESRSYAIKAFNLAFAFGTYLNFDQDIIFFDTSPVFERSEDFNDDGLAAAEYLNKVPEDALQIKNLAIVAYLPSGPDDCQLGSIAGTLRRDLFGNLNSVRFIVDDHRPRWRCSGVEVGDLTTEKEICFVNQPIKEYWRKAIRPYSPEEYDTLEERWIEAREDEPEPLLFEYMIAKSKSNPKYSMIEGSLIYP